MVLYAVNDVAAAWSAACLSKFAKSGCNLKVAEREFSKRRGKQGGHSGVQQRELKFLYQMCEALLPGNRRLGREESGVCEGAEAPQRWASDKELEGICY